MADLYVRNGFRTANNGTYLSAFQWTANYYGIEFTRTSNLDTAVNLLNNGYINTYGTIIFEKRYYPLLKFKKSDEILKYKEEDYYYGPYVISNRDEMFIKMLLSQLKYYEENNLLSYKKEEVKKIKKLLSLVK